LPKVQDYLEELDCYENAIEDIGENAFEGFHKLRMIDLSFNGIRVVPKAFNKIGNSLVHLYLVNNKIKVIENLNDLPKLKMLELGSNRLRVCAFLKKEFQLMNFRYLKMYQLCKI
jgi:Leucine-rich repeat (LRR) protein